MVFRGPQNRPLDPPGMTPAGMAPEGVFLTPGLLIEPASAAHPRGFSAAKDEGEEVLTIGGKTSSFHTRTGVASGHFYPQVDLQGVLDILLYSTSFSRIHFDRFSSSPI